MLLVGVLLVLGLIAPALGGTIGFARSGYNGDFWKLPRDDKLDHVATNSRGWWTVSISQLVGLFLLTGGLGGLTRLISDAGEPVLGSVGYGGYLVALMIWVLGLVVQTATVPSAARQRVATGETPAWVHGFFDVGYLAEAAWVIGANLSYVVIGMAIIGSGLVAAWTGWVALVFGLAIPATALVTRYWFPEMSLIVPFVIGISLVVHGS